MSAVRGNDGGTRLIHSLYREVRVEQVLTMPVPPIPHRLAGASLILRALAVRDFDPETIALAL